MWKSNYPAPQYFVPQPQPDPRTMNYQQAQPVPAPLYTQPQQQPQPRPRSKSVMARPKTPYGQGTNTMRALLHAPVASGSRVESWAEVQDPADIKRDAVRQLLHEVGMIRVGVEEAQNRGSVSASMAALKELMRRARGGTVFQVVYEKGAANNIATVLGDFNPQKARQQCTIEGKHILFIQDGNLSREDNNFIPKTKILGFVGANDGPDHHAGRWLDKLGNNEAGNAVAVAVGQPYGWKYGGAQSTVYSVNGDTYIHYLPDTVKGYPIQVPATTAQELSDEIRGAAGGRPEQLTLARVFAELGRRRIEMMPVYGLHQKVMKKTLGREDDLIRDLCAGIHMARHHGMSKRPVVLAVIGDYKTQLRPLGKDNVASGYNPNQGMVFAHQADAGQKIKYLNDGDIMVVYLGPVPQKYFDQLFRLSTLPPILEGANAANLCQNLPDKPYLHLNMDGTNFPETSVNGEGRQAARNVSALIGANDGNKRAQTQKALSEFMLHTRRPESIESKYFKQVNEDTRKKDQVTEVLYPIAELLTIGPVVMKPKLLQREISPHTGVQYEVWSDGKVYYGDPLSGQKKELSLEKLAPTAPGQLEFGKNHWDLPVDLQISKIVFDRRSSRDLAKARLTRPNLPVLETRPTANNNSFKFVFDENQGKLMVIEKNGNDKTERLVYRRDNTNDERYGAKAARYQGPQKLTKSKPLQNGRFKAPPLTRWLG